MKTPDPTPTPPALTLEQDSRFPSGPWTGFFLQPVLPGRHMMEIRLTFRDGRLSGEGRDWVGSFVLSGRYDVTDGRCSFAKTYVGRHTIAYSGYNEGKGIWGTWEWPQSPGWKGGFHIWPEAMGDPYAPKMSEAIDEPLTIATEVEEEVPASVL